MSSTKSNKKLFALVDCNNFYASCERVFNPKLIGKPLVVMSNNDGCVVARSQEAKAVGIAMGVPIFHVRELIQKHHVITCSSNYTLYGDMSRRVMQTLELISPHIQVYSIDEAFLLLQADTAEEQSQSARRLVRQHTGIPVSIGVAPTKTLAKIANEIAKKGEGVFMLADQAIQETVLRGLPVSEIWGIGHQISTFLIQNGIQTAWQLRDADDNWLRKHLTVVVLRTAWELRGISCLQLEQLNPSKKSIVSSKSFGRPVLTWEDAAEALSAYTARAAEKLRKQNSLASVLGVFIESKRDYKNDYYANQMFCTLPQPTAYTPLLIQHAKAMLRRLFRAGLPYKKVGIFLDGFVEEGVYQMDLFSSEPAQQAKQQTLMRVMDTLNKDFGRKVVRLAAEGFEQPWKMRRTHCSARFTTRWPEILTVQV